MIEFLVCVVQEGVGLRWIPPQRGLDKPELKRERDESLLRAVVQVSLQPASLAVGRLDDPRARVRELPVRVSVRQRLRHELGEVREPTLGAVWESRAANCGCDERAPDLPAKLDRCRGRRPVAEVPHAFDKGPPKIVVAVNPLWLARLAYRREDSGSTKAHARADGECKRAALTPRADERHGVVRVESG